MDGGWRGIAAAAQASNNKFRLPLAKRDAISELPLYRESSAFPSTIFYYARVATHARK